jgi:imidazolonepropionase-like amidohydrolase
MSVVRGLAAAVCIAASALSAQPTPPSAVAFLDVNVIPMDRERVLRDQIVIVQDGRIIALGPAESVRIRDGIRRIEARGQYLIPALSEMHAHIPGGDAPDAEIERVLFLYSANGIATIRGMLGHPRHLALRNRANKGEIVSPWIYTSGPSLNGNTVPTPEAAVRAVTEQKAAGYDFLKIHPGILQGPFDALADTAAKVHIAVAGHVPADVGLERALAARYATIDHLDGYMEALAGPGAPVSQLFGLNLVSRVDLSRMPRLVAASRDAGVAQVPTQALFEHWVGMTEPAEMLRWPEMRFVDRAQKDGWVANRPTLIGQTSAADRQRFLEIRRRLIKAMHDGGVTLLLGSDAPQVWNVPGFSIHRELQYLVQAGLTPFQALETGTRRVAGFFGTAAERGTIEVGKRADLVLLEGNPLEDIRETARIAVVVQGNRVFTRQEIDSRLKELER